MKLRIKRNYYQQDITKSEYLIMILQTAVLMLLLAITFYRSLLALIVLLPLGWFLFRETTAEKTRKKKLEFQKQFKDGVYAIAAGLSVGYSIENAVKKGASELALIYPAGSRIRKEFQIMIRQLELHIPIETVFEEMGTRTGQEDVQNFASVFITAKKNGGNLLEIISDTARQIAEKQEVSKDIETILTAKRYEFKIMSLIPFFIIGYMSLSFSDFMKPLYGNLLGIGVMSLCLGIYATAYYLGTRIIKIDI